MTDTRYAVQMHNAEQAKFLADRQGNSFQIEATGRRLEFDAAALEWFRSRSGDADGHVDTDRVLWFGGLPYPIAEVAR